MDVNKIVQTETLFVIDLVKQIVARYSDHY